MVLGVAAFGHGLHGHTAECWEVCVVVYTVGQATHTVCEMVQDRCGLVGMDCAEECWAIHCGYVVEH